MKNKMVNIIYAIMLLVVSGLLIGLIYISNDSKVLGEIYISEVCSENRTIVYNEEGLYYDYIEIHNTKEEAVNLTGWRLTDSLDTEEKPGLILDDVILQSGGYYVAFVSNKESSIGYSLSEGDTIYLLDAEGETVDILDVPMIEDNKALVYLDEEERWINNYYPSPGERNEEILVEESLPMLAESYIPVFSSSSGFYDSEFYLEITTKGDCDIYYTLDGSEPTQESILYTEPILISDATQQPNKWCMRTDISVKEYIPPDFLIDKCTIIRAVAVSKDNRYSAENTASYFVGFDGRYGYEHGYTISIITNPDNLFSEDKGIYVIGDVGKMNEDTLGKEYKAIVNYNRDGEGWRRPAVVHVFDENKECVYQQEIQLGIHGGNSTLSPQKGFNLVANEGEKMFPGLFSEKHSSLLLRGGGVKDVRFTKFRDVLNQRLVENRNIAIQEAIPCQVFLDGEYWGFYNLRERLDLSMIAAKYNVPEEDVIFIKNYWVLGRDDSYIQYYEDIVDYALENDLSVEEHYRKIEEWIDIQSFIEYCCMEIYCANSDSFKNNWALWRTETISTQPYCDGKWRWVVFDTDDSTSMLADIGMTGPEEDTFITGHWHREPLDEPLFSSLLENEEFRIRFAETFYDMCENEYDIDRVYGYIDELEEAYTEGVVLSHRRYFNPEYTEEMYSTEAFNVRFFYASRAYFIIPFMEEHVLNYSAEE